MTKSEMHLHDTAFIGPALLFLDQYFNSFIDEYIVLWIALVSISLFFWSWKNAFVHSFPYMCTIFSFATTGLKSAIVNSKRKPWLVYPYLLRSITRACIPILMYAEISLDELSSALPMWSQCIYQMFHVSKKSTQSSKHKGTAMPPRF